LSYGHNERCQFHQSKLIEVTKEQFNLITNVIK
jgi:hypothetical protein